MTTPARRAEARGASTIFHAALIAQGAQGAADALDSFDDVQPVPGRAASSSGKWLARILQSLVKRRTALGRLAAAYYRYQRALHTGYTYPPLEGEGDVDEPVSLNELREDFFSQVETLNPELLTSDRELVDDDGTVVTDSVPDGDVPIEVEEPEESLADILADTADDEDVMHDEMLNSGPVVLDKKMREIDDQAPAAKVDKERDAAHQQAGARAASAAERNVMNAGRDPVVRAGKNDSRAIGYVRVSGTGHPCGFCAMLISRGGLLYTSKRAAGEGKGNEWHPNCHCYVEPVYSGEQYDEDPRFDLNREFDELWPKVTRGKSGKDALNAWRTYIRNTWTPAQDASASNPNT